MTKKMTAPTKQQLRDEIERQRLQIEHLENQLSENELLREKLAKKAGALSEEAQSLSEQKNNLTASLMAYRECRFNASDVLQLTEQLSLSDVEAILYQFNDRFECFAVAGEGGYYLPFSDEPFTLLDGSLQIIFDTNKGREVEVSQ